MSAEDKAAIGVFENHSGAEAAIKQLQKSGFDIKKLSILGKDYQTEEHAVGYYNTGDRMKVWGKLGGFWGGLMGFMFGSAIFVIPGVGPLIVLGPLVGWIAGALEGAVLVGGLSALGAALFSVGIPKDSIIQYEKQLKAGNFLVVAHGTDQELEKAKDLLGTSAPAVLAGK